MLSGSVSPRGSNGVLSFIKITAGLDCLLDLGLNFDDLAMKSGYHNETLPKVNM